MFVAGQKWKVASYQHWLSIHDELNQIFEPQKLKTANAFHSVIRGLAHRAKDLEF